LDAAKPHLTQFADEIHNISKMSDQQLEQMISDPSHAWWSEPMTLIFGKAVVPTQPWEAIFPDVEPRQRESATPAESNAKPAAGADAGQGLNLKLGDPWNFYEHFRHAHQLTNLPVAHAPEIAVKSGNVVAIPLLVTRKSGATREITVNVTTPSGWRLVSGGGKFLLPDQEISFLRVELQSPDLPAEQLKGRKPDAILVTGTATDKQIGTVELNVLLGAGALPQ
jgi:hypothetical protein